MNKLNKLTLSHVDPNVILLKKQMQNILGGAYRCFAQCSGGDGSILGYNCQNMDECYDNFPCNGGGGLECWMV